MSSNLHRLSCPFVLLAMVLSGVGCGSGGDYGYVTGTIRMDGEPLKDAFVVFMPEKGGPGTTAYGQTDETGQYEMLISDSHNGILPGIYSVDIHTSDVAVDEMSRQYWLPERVPAKYNKKTELTGYEVRAGETYVFDFDLEGKPKQ